MDLRVALRVLTHFAQAGSYYERETWRGWGRQVPNRDTVVVLLPDDLTHGPCLVLLDGEQPVAWVYLRADGPHLGDPGHADELVEVAEAVRAAAPFSEALFDDMHRG